MIKNALTALAISAACVAAAPSAALAGDRHDTNRVAAGHYEMQNQRVRVPGKVVTRTRQVPVAGYYKTVYRDVQLPGRYETRSERVWVPEKLIRDSGRRGGVRVEAGPVTLRLKGRRHPSRTIPGHYVTQTKRVWIPGRVERRAVKEWVPACTRTETYQTRTADTFRVRRVRVWVPASSTRGRSKVRISPKPRARTQHQPRQERRAERTSSRRERTSSRRGRTTSRRSSSRGNRGFRVEFGF